MATTIKYTMGGTVNLGNFENVRIEFGIEDQLRDGEAMPDAIKRVTEFVETNWQNRVEIAVDKFREKV